MAFRKSLVVFFADYDHQVLEIERLYALLAEKLEKAKSADVSTEMVESIGYWLHNLYCACEDLFKITASFWENSIDGAAGYHIQMLKRMHQSVDGVRPALISTRRCYAALDELRAFRHVFRHAYSYGLDDARVLFLLRRVLDARELVLSEFKAFRDKIEEFLKRFQQESDLPARSALIMDNPKKLKPQS